MRKTFTKQCFTILTVLCIFLPCTKSLLAQEDYAKISQSIIAKHKKALYKKMNANHSWGPPLLLDSFDITTGETALALLALRYAGENLKVEKYRLGFEFLVKHPPKKLIYSRALYIMVLAMNDAQAYKKEIITASQELITAQADNGSWNYFGTGPGDLSVTQFALLGLDAARRAGIEIPESIWHKSQNFFHQNLNTDGGWPYQVGGPSKNSMTAAAAASLHLCGEELYSSLELSRGIEFFGQYQESIHLKKAIQQLGNTYLRKSSDFFKNGYLAYAFERMAIFYSLEKIPLGNNGSDWYLEGLKAYQKTQMPQKVSEIAFRLLFLAKGNTPIIAAKLRTVENPRLGENRRHNLRNMSRILSQELKTPVSHGQIFLNRRHGDLAKLPMIFWNSFGPSSLNEKEQLRLSQYLSDGGTLVICPDLDNYDFIDSCSETLTRLGFAGQFQELDLMHPIRYNYYDLRSSKLPLQHFAEHCSDHRIFLLSDDFSLKLEADTLSKTEQMTLANLSRYALKEKPLLPRLEKRKLTKTSTSKNTTTFKDSYADEHANQVAFYNINAKPSYSASSNYERLLSQYRQTSHSYSHPQIKELTQLTLLEMSQFPLIIITGKGIIQWDTESKSAILAYLKAGGRILFEARCGDKNFTHSAEQFMRQNLGTKLSKLSLMNDKMQSLIPAPKKDQRTLAEFKLLYFKNETAGIAILSPYDISSAVTGQKSFSPNALPPQLANHAGQNLLALLLGQ